MNDLRWIADGIRTEHAGPGDDLGSIELFGVPEVIEQMGAGRAITVPVALVQAQQSILIPNGGRSRLQFRGLRKVRSRLLPLAQLRVGEAAMKPNTLIIRYDRQATHFAEAWPLRRMKVGQTPRNGETRPGPLR